jgi:hypothetical protein
VIVAGRKSRRHVGSVGAIAAIGGIALICLALAATAALAFFYFSSPRKLTLDASSLCPVDGPRGITVVLVDTSDEIKETTRQDILTFLHDEITALSEYHKLDIRVLDIANARSRSLFSKCNPGDGNGLSEWTANPRIARIRWIESFMKPANGAVNSSLDPAKAKSSPIMGAVQDIALTQFSSAAVQEVPKVLILISDMLEFTQDYSQYPSAGDLSYQRFRQSRAYLKFRTDLHSAGVTIQYVPRTSPKIDTRRHIEFWREWILDNRGKYTIAHMLQGTN